MHYSKLHIVFIIGLIALFNLQSYAQSASFGNTFIHNEGESVIFGIHDFDKGSMGALPGIIGTQRTTPGSSYGILGFSDVSPGWKGIGNDSYVDGYVKKYGDRAFVFPIGDNGKYRPVAISGADGTTAAYYNVDPASAVTNTIYGGNYAALPVGGPFPQNSKSLDVVNVSDLEYWDIDGATPTEITLTWDIFSEIERISNNNLLRLTIVGWDGERWQVIPSSMDPLYLSTTRSTPKYNGGISNEIQGSITSTIAVVPDQYLAYTFGTFASGAIGDYVWEDLNRNGIQEVGEPGIEDVEVQLFLNENDSLIMTTSSDDDGRYLFAGVAPGTYYLQFNPTSAYAPTLPNQGTQDQNSDLTFSSATAPFELEIDESLYGLDGGFYQTGSIGNLVWADTNNDGIQNEGEVGVNDVSVELLDEVGGEPVATTVTNPDGSFAFTNLSPGEYMIRVIAPAGYSIGPYKASLDNDIDSDINPVTGQSEMIELISGQVIQNIDAAISLECEYTAEIEITAPDCGTSNGFIQSTVDGDSGPYTYEWSTGETTPFAANVDTGYYTLIISDRNNCLRTFAIDITYADDCEMICAELNVHVNLQGPYNYDTEKMNVKLNDLGYLPGQKPTTFLGKYTDAGHPYREEPWFRSSTEGMTYESGSTLENNLYYDNDVVDWVLVSLRSTENIEYEACTRAGMLHEDGLISFPEDNCCLVDPTKEYYVVVEHRNHLIVMSKSRMPVEGNTITYDFRSNQSYTRLLGQGQKEVAPGVFAMYMANGDQFSVGPSATDINVGDLTEWLKENGLHSSYYRQDYDLNGDANVQDKSMYLENIGIFSDVFKGN